MVDVDHVTACKFVLLFAMFANNIFRDGQIKRFFCFKALYVFCIKYSLGELVQVCLVSAGERSVLMLKIFLSDLAEAGNLISSATNTLEYHPCRN